MKLPIRQFLCKALPAAAVLAGYAFAQTTASTASRTYTFPAVGLASSETAQVNLLNLAANSSSGTAASCTGSVSFLNTSGATIGTATTFTVTTEQLSSVSLPFSKSGATGLRTEVRAVVTLNVSSTSAPCALSTTLETYDTATGATHLHLVGQELEGPRNRY